MGRQKIFIDETEETLSLLMVCIVHREDSWIQGERQGMERLPRAGSSDWEKMAGTRLSAKGSIMVSQKLKWGH